MESRVFPSDLMKRLIACYKENTSLWKVGSREYLNRSLKAKAYQKLIDVVKQRYPEADKDFIVRKINSLRSCFRKEHCKVLKSRRTSTNPDDIYKPSLWYYDLLLFTADKDSSKYKEVEDEEICVNYDGSDIKKEHKNYSADMSDPLSLCMPLYKHPSNNSNNNKMKPDNEIVISAYETSTKEDEYDAYGITVAAKLRKMTDHQRLFSENLINQILFKGMFNKLSENTVLYECNANTEQHLEIMSTICQNNM